MRYALIYLLAHLVFGAESIPCDALCADTLHSHIQSHKSPKSLTHNPFPTPAPHPPTRMQKPHYLKLEAVMNAKALIDGVWYASGKVPFGTITGVYSDHITLAQGGKLHTIKISQNIVWYK